MSLVRGNVHSIRPAQPADDQALKWLGSYPSSPS